MCYPCNLRCKAFYMILLFLQKTLRNEHRHIYILYTCLLKFCIQLSLNLLPDRIACRLDDHTALNAGVITQLCFLYHIGIPLCEIHIHGCDRFYKFLVVCHFLFPFPLQNKNAAFPSVRGHAALPPCCILILPLSPVLRYTFMQDSKAGSKASHAGISQPVDSLSGHFHFVLFLINVTFAISLCQS